MPNLRKLEVIRDFWAAGQTICRGKDLRVSSVSIIISEQVQSGLGKCWTRHTVARTGSGLSEATHALQTHSHSPLSMLSNYTTYVYKGALVNVFAYKCVKIMRFEIESGL